MWRWVALAGFALCLSGTAAAEDGVSPTESPVINHMPDAADEADDVVSDPWEPFNRAMFSFNKKTDQWVVKPVTKAYVKVLPEFVQTGIGNFIMYLKTPVNMLYFALQGNGHDFGAETARLFVNTFGLGVYDLASQQGIPMKDTNFGETMGVWGIGDGPYVVLPFLGGDSLRGTTGLVAVDYPVSIESHFPVAARNTATGVEFINRRRKLLPFDQAIEQASFDEYEFVRDGIVNRERARVQQLKDGRY